MGRTGPGQRPDRDGRETDCETDKGTDARTERQTLGQTGKDRRTDIQTRKVGASGCFRDSDFCVEI